MRTLYDLLGMAGLGFIATLATAEEALPVHGDRVAVFASLDEGRTALSTRDRFVEALSPFDIQCRLATDRPATADDLLRFAADQVVEWSAPERDKLRSVIASVRERTASLQLPLPKTLLLIKTTGREEGNAAYTRGNAIVFPQRYVDELPARLERIFIHELFHVLSSHNAPLRESLYAIIGFQPCSEIPLPQPLASRKITNPDGPTLSNYIKVAAGDQEVAVVPLLFSPRPYDAQRGGSIFDYLQFRLLAVREDDGRWEVVWRDGEPWLLDSAATPSYQQQLGDNTRYIIHPDEVLADNFVHLVMKTAGLPSPQIVERMRERLQAERAAE